MAKAKAQQKNKYSVILPTYNERQNLPVLVQMLYDTFTAHNLDWEVSPPLCCPSSLHASVLTRLSRS